MVRGGRPVRDVAERLDVSQQSLRKWSNRPNWMGEIATMDCAARSCADFAARTPG